MKPLRGSLVPLAESLASLSALLRGAAAQPRPSSSSWVFTPNSQPASRTASAARRHQIYWRNFWRATLGAVYASCGVVACSLALDTSKLNEGCPDDTKPCHGQCVSKLRPEYGCGNSSCAPCVLDHAKSNCSPDFKCSIAACAPRYQSCDLDDSTGCEANIYESKTSCGGCGAINDCTAQSVQNVKGTECGAGACYVKTCETGWFDCNGVFSDGCEVPSTQLASDISNCGKCNVECDAGQSCVDSSCH